MDNGPFVYTAVRRDGIDRSPPRLWVAYYVAQADQTVPHLRAGFQQPGSESVKADSSVPIPES